MTLLFSPSRCQGALTAARHVWPVCSAPSILPAFVCSYESFVCSYESFVGKCKRSVLSRDSFSCIYIYSYVDNAKRV